VLIKALTTKINLKKLNLRFNINPVFSKEVTLSIFFFLALMPYVSPVPLGTDIQVLTGLVGYMILFVLLYKDRFLVDKRELLILGLCLFFVFYINIEESTYQLKKAIGPLYSFGIFYIAKRYNHYFSIRVLTIVIVIYLIGTITQLISVDLFKMTFEHLLRESKYSAAGIRGVTSLAPEPSFLGVICIFILIIQNWFYKGKKRDKYYYYRFAACAFMILLTKSGMGYVLFFLFLGSQFMGYIKKYWYISLFVGIGFVFFMATAKPISGNKGLSDLIGVLKSTSPRDLLRVSSFSNRVNPILVGLYGAYERPLGRGSGSFTTQAKQVYIENDLEDIYPAHMRSRLLYEISSDSVSSFGKYLFEYGIFFLLYLMLIFSGLDLKQAGLFTIFLVLIGLLFSLPIVYPPIWLIYGIFDKKGGAKKL
tara:strand:- start:6014 stop:7279 length:1266 start_codon:yes stop_codon:yes gene_type:complete